MMQAAGPMVVLGLLLQHVWQGRAQQQQQQKLTNRLIWCYEAAHDAGSQPYGCSRAAVATCLARLRP